MTTETLHDRILRLRVDAGLSREALAKSSDVSVPTVARWEHGINKPRGTNAALAAKALGVTVDELLTGQKGEAPPASESPEANKGVRARRYRVVGELLANEWRDSIEWPYDEQYDTFIPSMRGMTDRPMQGYIIGDDSMNMFYPAGTLVLVTGSLSGPIRPRHGQKVLVLRSRADGKKEASIKEYVVDAKGEEWLWPRSTSAEFQGPVRLKNTEDEQVTIAGIEYLHVAFGDD